MCLDQQRNRGWLFEATKKTFSRRLFSKQTNFNNICNIFEQIDYKAALTICCRNCDPRHLFYRLSIPFWIFGFVPEISFFEVTALPSVRRATCVEKLSMECTSWRACGNVLQRTLQEKFRDMCDMCDMCDMSVPRPPILSVLLDAVVASDSSNKPATSVASQVRQMKRVEPCFCVFSICFVATCCMSMHVIACLRRTPFGPLYICYCWSIRHLGMDPSLWKYALPHCSQFGHWIFWPCRDIETTRFWIWMFFPAIFVAVDRTSSFRETWEVEKLSCKFAARYLTQQYTICGIP